MGEVTVLCYHAVSPTWEDALAVHPALLERQLAFLVGRGWQSATFADAVLAPPAERTLAITFDDALASVQTFAVPILERLGLVATVFAPTAYVDRGERIAWPGVDHWLAGEHAGELTPMSWEELGVLTEHGWEIGSHTRTHPHLTQLDDDALAEELAGSRSACADRLGSPCRTIAYPYGDVDERVAQAAADAGYAAGACLSSRLQQLGPHRFPRIGIYRADDWARFRLKVARPIRALRGSALWERAMTARTPAPADRSSAAPDR
jgi:peptidoglycan/xylan/chitin deacetylase (PgdA/CDA1 family)